MLSVKIYYCVRARAIATSAVRNGWSQNEFYLRRMLVTAQKSRLPAKKRITRQNMGITDEQTERTKEAVSGVEWKRMKW